jgi:hypothetical protein
VHPGQHPGQGSAAAPGTAGSKGLFGVQDQKTGDPAAFLALILINGHGGVPYKKYKKTEKTEKTGKRRSCVPPL